jgi:hypothetical protein
LNQAKDEFIRQLRAAVQDLKPLTLAVLPGAAVWDGTRYTKGSAASPDPFALSWSSMLGTIAELVEAQETPLSLKQINYLTRVLFGGMGSLNDLFFDPKSAGATAATVNENLSLRRTALYESFKRMTE